MLQRLDIKLAEYWFGYDEYYVFYDDEYMTQEQAEKALEFIDWGSWEPELTPYYLIVPVIKKPIIAQYTVAPVVKTQRHQVKQVT